MAGTSRSSASVGWAAWSSASAVETGGEWAIVAIGAGRDCAPGRLVEATRLTPSHDERLAAATKQINQVLGRTASANTDAGRSPRLLVTPFGRVAVWVRHDGQGQASGIALERDPEGFCRTVGLSTEAQRAPGRYRDWVIDEEGNLICCRKGPNTQGVAELYRPASPISAHDAALVDCTNQVNAIMQQAASEKPSADPNLVLALLTTPLGLFLAWTINDDNTNENPPGAITARSDEDTIFRALGLTRPSGGGPPWKFILPGAVGAAAIGGIVIACAAGAFSGDGPSSTDAAPSATAQGTAVTATAPSTAAATAARATDLPAQATPTTVVVPTSPQEPTEGPVATSPNEPTSNLEPTRPPAATRTPDIPPQT